VRHEPWRQILPRRVTISRLPGTCLTCRKEEKVKTYTSTENSVKQNHPPCSSAIIMIPACRSSSIHPHALPLLHPPGARLLPALSNRLHYTAFCKLSELWITRKNTGSCISALVKHIFERRDDGYGFRIATNNL